MYVCVSHECSAWGAQKRSLNTMELELELVQNYHVAVGN